MTQSGPEKTGATPRGGAGRLRMGLAGAVSFRQSEFLYFFRVARLEPPDFLAMRADGDLSCFLNSLGRPQGILIVSNDVNVHSPLC